MEKEKIEQSKIRKARKNRPREIWPVRQEQKVHSRDIPKDYPAMLLFPIYRAKDHDPL
jgi:hypothetical protein